MTKREGNKKLKACPFCGSKARIFTAPNGYYGIQCDKIGCVMMSADYERSVEKIVKDWNRRQQDNG